MMAALMVVCGLQITPMTAKAAENEKTYTFAQMTKLMEWGVTSSVDEDGVLSLDYSGQYKSCFYGIPSDLDFSKV